MLEQLFARDEKMQRETEINWATGFKYLLGNVSGGALKATADNALLFDTVYACINVLSDDIAKLPFKTYYKDKNGAITQVKDNDVHKVLRIRPNRYMTPFTFIKLMITDVCTDGNFYAYIKMNEVGAVEELIPLTASKTIPKVSDKSGDLYYQTTFKNKLVILPSYQVIHIKGMSYDGVRGVSPISSVRLQLESNDMAGRYNHEMIKKGGMPQGILKATGVLNKESKDKMREHWKETNGGETIAIVDNGLDYQQIGISQADMQWLQSQKYNVQRVAAIYKVPLHKINDLDKATYTNIEHQSLDYVKNTLQPWVTQIEAEFTYKLYSQQKQKEGYYVKFNMDSELRGDSEARAKVNEINLRNGFKTINEVRASNEDSPYDEEYANKAFLLTNYATADNIDKYGTNHFAKKGGENKNDG